jgi:hypothetical protein
LQRYDFTVIGRPTLAEIVKHPSVGFADYERRLDSMQSVMQSIQQSYLGSRERAVIVLEGTASIQRLQRWRVIYLTSKKSDQALEPVS